MSSPIGMTMPFSAAGSVSRRTDGSRPGRLRRRRFRVGARAGVLAFGTLALSACLSFESYHAGRLRDFEDSWETRFAEDSGFHEFLLAAVDRELDPCDDFYQYACGGWLAGPTRREERGNAGRILNALVRGHIDRRFEYVNSVRDSGATDPAARRVRQFLDRCEASKGANRRYVSEAELQELMRESLRDVSPEGFARQLARAHHEGIGVLFEFTAVHDGREPDRRLFAVAPVPPPYAADAYDEASPLYPLLRTEYLRASIDFDEDATGRNVIDSRQSFAVDSALARAYPAPGTADRWTPTVAPTSVEALAEASGFVWRTYLDERGLSTVDALAVVSPQYFRSLGEILASQPTEFWLGYVALRRVNSRRMPVFTDCRILATQVLGPEIDHAMPAASIPASSSAFAQRTFDEIRNALIHEVGRDPYISEAAAASSFAERLRAARLLVGMPPEPIVPPVWPIEGGLFAILDHQRRAEWSAATTEAFAANVRDSSSLGIGKVDIPWYSASLNLVHLPPATARRPLLASGIPAAFRYGQLGAILGHELAHAIGAPSRGLRGDGTFDADLARTWDKGIRELRQCVASGFDEATVAPSLYSHALGRFIGDGIVHGDALEEETTADVLGARAAWRACRDAGACDDQPVGAGESNLTEAQAFFLAFTQLWCTDVDPHERWRDVFAEHAPDRLRTNRAPMQIPEFAATFHCEEPAKMVAPRICGR